MTPSKAEAAVINLRRIRDFAKGIVLDAKTDPIDAKVTLKYGEVVVPKPMATKSEHEQKHGALVARLNQSNELINQENNRLKQSWDDDAKESIQGCHCRLHAKVHYDTERIDPNAQSGPLLTYRRLSYTWQAVSPHRLLRFTQHYP